MQVGKTTEHVIKLSGMDCPSCAADIERRIRSVQGVESAEVNFTTAQLVVKHAASVESIVKTLKEAGYGAELDGDAGFQRSVFQLGGLDCADCASKLEKILRASDGIHDVTVNLAAAKLTVQHTAKPDDIVRTVREAGYEAKLEESRGATSGGEAFNGTSRRILMTAVSGVFLVTAWVLSLLGVGSNFTIPIYLLAILAGGFWTFRRGIFALRAGTFDMNVLMTVAVTGAAVIGKWSEGASVAFLYSVSNLLESFTMERTRQSIRSLMEIAPREARVRRNGSEVRLPVEDIEVNDVVVVRPGEKIPMDGIVVSGNSSVNQAPITGESMPVDKGVDEEVYAGSINLQGVLQFRVTKLSEDTTLAKIIHLVEEAQAQKAPSQTFVERFATYYTPAVIIVAVAVALVPPLLFAAPWATWIYRALALIVVACPCALVISTPVSIVSAVGSAAKHGVLIKGGSYLEEAGAVSVLAFDKTGTLTKGRLEVTDIIHLADASEEELLSMAAAVEQHSEHPLAEAIARKAKQEGTHIPSVEGFESMTGKGVKALVDGRNVYIGNTRLFEDLGIDTSDVDARLTEYQKRGKTAILVGTEQGISGIIAVADQVRHESRAVIRGLHTAGVQKVVMLTGDNSDTAGYIAGDLGIDDFRADLLPQDKVDAVKELIKRFGKVAMVGDGVNDAPALATATVGVAMGVVGSDTALETADIALMSDDLSRLPYIIRLSRETLHIIKQNITFSLLVKAVAVTLIFPGWLALWMAVMADMGASVLVTLNGMRLIRVKPKHP